MWCKLSLLLTDPSICGSCTEIQRSSISTVQWTFSQGQTEQVNAGTWSVWFGCETYEQCLAGLLLGILGSFLIWLSCPYMTSCLKTLRLTCCDLPIPSQQLNSLFWLIVFFSRSIAFQLIFSMLANSFPNPLCSRTVIVLFH